MKSFKSEHKKSDYICVCYGQKSSECQVPHTDKYSALSV